MSRRAPRMYSTTEVMRMTGASYRMLDYYCRTGRIPGQPAGTAHGSGTRRVWTDEDVRVARRLVVVSWLRCAPIDDVMRLLDDVGALTKIEREFDDLEGAFGRPPPLKAVVV